MLDVLHFGGRVPTLSTMVAGPRSSPQFVAIRSGTITAAFGQSCPTYRYFPNLAQNCQPAHHSSGSGLFFGRTALLGEPLGMPIQIKKAFAMQCQIIRLFDVIALVASAPSNWALGQTAARTTAPCVPLQSQTEWLARLFRGQFAPVTKGQCQSPGRWRLSIGHR